MRETRTDKQLVQHLTFNERLRSVGLDFDVDYGHWRRDILPPLSSPV